jgi:hypothetical protein
MEYFWNSNSFVVFRSNESTISYRFFNRITRIDIEPITINFGMFE